MALRPKSIAFYGKRDGTTSPLTQTETPPSGKAWIFKEARYVVEHIHSSAPAGLIELQQVNGEASTAQALFSIGGTTGTFAGVITDADQLFVLNDGVLSPMYFDLTANPNGTGPSFNYFAWAVTFIGIEVDL